MPRKVDAQQLRLEALADPPQSTDEPDRASDPGSRKGKDPKSLSGGAESLQDSKHASSRPSPTELLDTPGALLTRSHLRGLGLERRAIDAVFRALPVVALPGYSRPMVRADQFLELVEHSTYRGDRVRPSHA